MTDSQRIDLEADFPTDFDAELDVDATPTAQGDPSTVAEAGPDPVAEPKPDAPPVVVIEYRNRGIPPILMFPLALVVSLAMFAAYHILVIRPKNQELREAAIRAGKVAAGLSEKAPAGADDPESTSGSLAGLPMPLTLESQPLPPGFQLPPPSFNASPPIVVAPPASAAPKADPGGGEPANPNGEAAPEAEAVAKAKPNKPPLAVGFARPTDKPAAPVVEVPPAPEPAAKDEPEDEGAPKPIAEIALAPKPDILVEPPTPPADEELAANEPPPPSRDEMIEALQNEAQAQAVHQDELLRRKQEARARVEAEAQQRVEDERTAFRRALYDIVTSGGVDAGQRIDQLCNQFGRNYSDEIRDRVTAYLTRVHGRISRESEIRLLRTLGVPEPGILDFLANGVKVSLNSRNGPRNPDEVRVMAAKQLLRSRPAITEVDAARASSAMPRFPGR